MALLSCLHPLRPALQVAALVLAQERVAGEYKRVVAAACKPAQVAVYIQAQAPY
jgi:hypothetical protein